MPYPPAWRRKPDVPNAGLDAVREVFAEDDLPPGAATFAVRGPDTSTLYFTPAAAPIATEIFRNDDTLVTSGPPKDSPHLRLLCGDRGAWRQVFSGGF